MEDADAKLVERARSGESAAFRELVVLYSPKVFRLAYRITGDEATAEDLSAFNAKFGTKRPLPPESESDKKGRRQEGDDLDADLDEDL